MLLSEEELHELNRIADEPFYWIRKYVPEARDWEEEFYTLVDNIKGIWKECRINRINLSFALTWQITDDDSNPLKIMDYSELQKMQNSNNSELIFVIDIRGKIIDSIKIDQEITHVSIRHISQIRQIVIFWIGPEFQVFCQGFTWTPQNKGEVLREIKSKRRENLLSMDDIKSVIDTHFNQYILDEARVNYWFDGKKNSILMPTPERIFQKSLWDFLNREVDCTADREPMFKDGSRCDIRIIVDYSSDLYFIEIKWIGRSAKRHPDKLEISAQDPFEFDVARAIDGAYQTKKYIEKNNSIGYDQRIKLAVYLVYDAYPNPVTPINYGSEIKESPLLEILEYRLVTFSPSVETRGIAKRKGLA
ncbi:MAG: hypothetical protein EXR62_05195 [Chloroflexi bacterium]|nr:hypothetical protein [Chloroflexota bacterium]